MKNLKYLLFLMVVASLSFVSCIKDDDDDEKGDDDPVGKKDMLISKVIRTVDGSYSEYTYNADYTVNKIANFSSTGTDYGNYYEYTYTNGKLATCLNYASGTENYKYIFSYNGDKPSTIEVHINQGAGVVYAYDIKYTFVGEQIAKIEYLRAATGVFIENTYTYTGDVVSRIDLQSNTGGGLAPNGYTEYDFDSKNNPSHGIGIDYFLGDIAFLMPNNMNTTKMVSAADVVNQALSVNVTYEYDANDNPTKSTSITFDTNIEKISIFEYIEK